MDKGILAVILVATLAVGVCLGRAIEQQADREILSYECEKRGGVYVKQRCLKDEDI